MSGREVERDGPWDADGIAKALGQLMSDGTLASGDLLPPIRSMASHLGVSSSTVAAAWAIMRRHRLIETDRRRGTTVRPFAGHGRSRYWQVPTGGRLEVDLSTGTPDPELLPPLGPVLATVLAELEAHPRPEITSYLDPPVLADLEVELRRRWPYDAPAFTIVDGANDGLDRVIAATIKLGDVVLVEDPTYPLLLDQLDLAGAEIVGLPLDDHGPRLDAVGAALDRDPAAIVLQTSAHNPTGISLSPDRAEAIAQLLAPTDVLIIEDDHAGTATTASNTLSNGAPLSLGRWLPARVYHIHSFSKTYGPDLRIAALSGPVEGIDQIQRRRQLGPGWTSRLIQRTLLAMLTSDRVSELVAKATEIYAYRREQLGKELTERGVPVHVGHGLNLWVPVGSEQLATIGLAAAGIGVSPGEPFRVHDTSPHVRVTAANARGDFSVIADALAAAADPRMGR